MTPVQVLSIFASKSRALRGVDVIDNLVIGFKSNLATDSEVSQLVEYGYFLDRKSSSSSECK
jgi:hypothetical protein